MWYSVREKAGPANMARVDRIDEYRGGHEKGEALFHSRNEPIVWPDGAAEAVWTGDELRAATADELALIQAYDEAKAAAEEDNRINALVADYAGPLALVLAALTRFEIQPPITFDAAAGIMNSQAETVGDLKLVVMAKMAFERHLEPAKITGDTLAACAVRLMEKMNGA